MNPFLAVDGYKIFHHLMTPKGTSIIYSNLTPRSNKHAPKMCEKVVVFGTQMAIREIVKNFDDNFFMIGFRDVPNNKIKEKVCGEIKKEFSQYSGTDYDVSHIEDLWDLGYLPIRVKALPEGTLCPMGVPVLTIVNTHPDFAWVTNFLETMLSNLIWKPMTSATLAYAFKRLNDKWIEKTDKGNDFHSKFGCHDFSMRGLDSLFATMSSGLGHAVSFQGSDSLPVIHAARQYYDEKDYVVGSIPATEHSIQCAYYNGTDYDYVKEMISRFPSGPLGIVSDGYDLFALITEILPKLKEQIIARTGGPVVIRPDSGNPVDIICGTGRVFNKPNEDGEYNIQIVDGKYYEKEWERISNHRHEPYMNEIIPTSEQKGVIELLWDIFGGTTNNQGYKVLHPCIRMIYGDAINLDRFDEINTRLEAKGFASTNWVAGVGSFTYQFNTRDTFGFAVKATYIEIMTPTGEKDSVYNQDLYKTEGKDIFKDPKTDDGTKKSAKGLLCVLKNSAGEIYLKDKVDWETEERGLLQTIFENGKFSNVTTLTEIRERINKL